MRFLTNEVIEEEDEECEDQKDDKVDLDEASIGKYL